MVSLVSERRAQLLLGVVLFMLLSGCMAYRHGGLKTLGRLAKPASAKVEKASYQVVWIGNPLYRGRQPGETFRELHEVLEEAGYTVVLSEEDEGALHIDVFLFSQYKEDPRNSQFLSGFTIFAVPGYRTVEYHLRANVLLPNGDLRTYVIGDSATVWTWIPFAIVSAFMKPDRVESKLVQNMCRHVLKRLRDEGLVPE